MKKLAIIFFILFSTTLYSYEEVVFETEHNNWLNCVALSKSTKYLITSAYDKTLKIWDFHSKKLLNEINIADEFIAKISITPCEKYFVTSDVRSNIAVREMKSGKLIYSIYGNAYCISPDGKFLIISSQRNQLFIWSFDGKRLYKRLSVPSNCTHPLVVDPSGWYLISFDCKKILSLWDIKTKEEIWNKKMIGTGVSAVSINDRGELLAVSLVENKKTKNIKNIYFLFLKTGEIFKLLDYNDPQGLSSIKFSGNNKYFYTGGRNDYQIVKWDFVTGKKLWIAKSGSQKIDDLILLDDKDILFSYNNSTIEMWSSKTGKLKKRFLLKFRNKK